MFAKRYEGEARIELPSYEKDGIPLPQVMLAGIEVTKYADYYSMWADLAHVVALCDASIALEAEIPIEESHVELRGLWEAAVIAYGRAFTSGVSAFGGGRTRFPGDLLDRLTEEQRTTHNHAVELRNRHVGHRVNDWTQVRVSAVLAQETEPKFLQLSQALVTVVQGTDATAKFREVVVFLRDALAERMTSIGAGIEAGVRSIPVERLYASSKAGDIVTVV